MRKSIFIILIFLVLFSCKEHNENKEVVTNAARPNIIYILADDLGYAEIGAYGQEKIETPNIDALAKEGMLFTQHYTSAPVCAPARYMLLTGTHSGKAYIRGNDEWGDRGQVGSYTAMAKDSTLEGQRPMPDSTVTIAQKLKEVGYTTAIFGKWGLGAPHTNSIPTKMGFDYFFGYNCQRQAHTYYPLHLYKNENRVHLNNDTIAPNTKLLQGADINDPNSYAAYTLNEYAPDLMFKELSGFVDRNTENPFFVYWATPIPHAAIQAPKNWVDYYINKFGKEEPYLGEKGYFPHQNPHAGYAAMISYLDENIGKLVAQLKSEGIYDNTLIVFTSDNGPTFNGGSDSPWFNSAKPFKSERGKGKGFVYEGGIRVPMIATWPGHIKPGTTTDHISVHYDVMATLADIAGYEKPAHTDGISFMPTLFSDNKQNQHDFLYWEFPEYGGQLAIRMGDYKVVRTGLKDPKSEPTLELYNLKTDIGETLNIADQHPEVIAKAAKIIDSEHTEPEIDKFKIPGLKEGFIN
ncbi:N-acetylgalactosamine-6-O-sulfatase [Arenibacter antarcticus]|uniref:Arylsulfatase n=1 Tax=Arenibacter antarcticus TaxID=2040469 RepID=A0ABW5VJF0_9FLAO|nr:arylsulfatase [Arenibacter sp. H213]MCM4169113.1 N-acetylgalactosamine-6-sulfatase [Arenibacter sp. H213]